LPREVEDGFLLGLFTAKLSSGKFNNVWVDYTLEAIENNALNGTGGIIGLAMKDGAFGKTVSLKNSNIQLFNIVPQKCMSYN